MHRGGLSEVQKLNIHNSSTANVLPLLESVKFRAESFAENEWLGFAVVYDRSGLFYLSLQPLNFKV